MSSCASARDDELPDGNSGGQKGQAIYLVYFQVFKPLVDKPDLFKAKKLPVEFLSDNKLVFQEYSHLKTVTVSTKVHVMPYFSLLIFSRFHFS